MTLEEFVKLVVAVRNAQKDCNFYVSREADERRVRLEKKLDTALLEIVGRYVSQMEPLPGFVELSEPSNGS